MRHLVIGVIFGVMVATIVSAESPYIGQQTREVKALSTQGIKEDAPNRAVNLLDASESEEEGEARKFTRRYLDYPSHYRFLWSLPKLKAVVLENAQEGWDTGVTADMKQANYDVIDFLEYSWLRVAEFYPSDHWGEDGADAYIRSYIQDRFLFHSSKHEPDGPGTGGTIVGVLTGGDVIHDLENLIADTVSALFMYQDDFDFQKWKSAWEGESQ